MSKNLIYIIYARIKAKQAIIIRFFELQNYKMKNLLYYIANYGKTEPLLRVSGAAIPF